MEEELETVTGFRSYFSTPRLKAKRTAEITIAASFTIGIIGLVSAYDYDVALDFLRGSACFFFSAIAARIALLDKIKPVWDKYGLLENGVHWRFPPERLEEIKKQRESTYQTLQDVKKEQKEEEKAEEEPGTKTVKVEMCGYVFFTYTVKTTPHEGTNLLQRSSSK